MHFKLIYLTIAAMFIATQAAITQTLNDPLIDQYLDAMGENLPEDFDLNEFTERLSFYRRNPVDVNRATEKDLKELFFLTPTQISSLLEHIRKAGPLIDTLELQAIDGFDDEVMGRLIPFIKIGHGAGLGNLSVDDVLTKGNSELLVRAGQIIEDQNGFIEDPVSGKKAYLGSAFRLYCRYRYVYNRHLVASLTMEKDAGEDLAFKNGKYGFDFYSGSIFYRGDGKISRLAAGDYTLQFGQALAMWSGMSFGKGGPIATVPKQDVGLKPYSSANEFLYFRGLAATILWNRFSITPFISYRRSDASLVSPGNENGLEVGAINETGNHRTGTESANKNTLVQFLYGVNLQLNFKRSTVGLVVYQSDWDHAFRSGEQLYEKYSFAGKRLATASVYYTHSWRNFYFFGEFAAGSAGGKACVNGIIASLAPKVSLVLLHRNYEPDFYSLFNQAISESTKAVDEKGVYMGLVFNPVRKVEVSLYADTFRFPWLRYRADAPSTGYELFSQVTYSFNKRFKAVARFKFKCKEENDEENNAINGLVQVAKASSRIDLAYYINRDLQVKNRLELVHFSKGTGDPENGYLMYQDLTYNPPVSKLSASIRFAIFDTASFDSRLYAYENDVLYSYSVPVFQNKGTRWYLNASYRLNRAIDVWLRYAVTSFSNRDEIGTGPDLIKGNHKSEVKLQLRLRF